MARLERNKPREQDPKVRARNFDEVSLGFDVETAILEAKRCLQCRHAPCKGGCPVGVNIPEFINEITRGNFERAFQIIKLTNSLPGVCGRVCPQEKQCEAVCVRRRMEGPVAIGLLERFASDTHIENYPVAEGEKLAPNGKRVAVVGSGPAGLTFAGDMARAGCEVTVYEAFHRAGGVLVYGIPEFRLPKSLVKREIDDLLALGVTIEHNVVVGKTITIEQLMEDYDGIFIGSGAGLPKFMGIPGENLAGVSSANEYLTRVNLMGAYKPGSPTPVQRGKNVAVIGAGNVAMDAARTALRMGADTVSVIYRRGREEMPAREEEIHHAEEEGVRFMLLTNPVEILGNNGRATGIKCVKMELGEPDSSGRRRPQEVPGSEFEVPADMVIVSLGTSPNPLISASCPQLQTSPRGTFIVDERTLETTIPGVYAGGDAVSGAATVILAMGAGKNAASAMMEKFGIK